MHTSVTMQDHCEKIIFGLLLSNSDLVFFVLAASEPSITKFKNQSLGLHPSSANSHPCQINII